MAQQQAAGAIILDQLRERIMTGLFLGKWEPGERLPSIRDVAGVENVDRKTAAAAYRRLQQEGLVRVEPRSGVYLREPPGAAVRGDPLERLHRRWLENLYDGARDLGLDTHTILRLVSAVAETEQRRIPVVEADWSQAEAIAHELRDRLGIRAVPYLLDEVRGDESVQRTAPFIVTTPFHRAELSRLSRGKVIETTLAHQTFRELRRRAKEGAVLVIVPTEAVARRVERALEQHHLLGAGADARVLVSSDREQILGAVTDVTCTFIWPGTPAWVALELKAFECIIPAHTLSSGTLARVRHSILDAALHLARNGGSGDSFSNTSGDGARPRTAALDA
jgi:GntR family transcriptional regulator